MRHHDCDALGLDNHQRAQLTGFSSRAVRALAHLREAWCGASPSNRPHVEDAIRALLATHSLEKITGITQRVLSFGLDDGLAARLRQTCPTHLPRWP